MITRNQIVPIGHIAKLHGIHGELVAVVDSDVELAAGSCVVMEIEGIFVPFFIESARRRSAESMLITLSGYASQKEAAEFQGLTLYMTVEDLDAQGDGDSEFDDEDGDDDGGFYANDLIGVTLASDTGGDIGKIVDLETSTANVLFIVSRPDGSIVYVPVAPELVTGFDHEARRLTMSLPEGLLDL